jgi:ATP-dependent RNA helicase DeaD
MPGKKDLALARLLDTETVDRVLIFCRTRVEVERLSENLESHGYEVAALHGGIDQAKRDRILKRFKQSASELLVATDVAARGLHVDRVSHVINVDLPTSPEVYVHRIGRTGRAGAAGTAISLFEPREHRLLKNIERFTRTAIPIKPLPTLAELQTQRLGVTRSAIEKALAAGGLETFRQVVEGLADSAELVDVAAAAVAALHQQLTPPRKGDETEFAEWKPGAKPEQTASATRQRPAKGAGAKTPRRADERRGGNTRFVRLFISVGESAGVRPNDLVGAIANEAGLTSKEIGAIQILKTHSIVEVAEERAGEVVEALQTATLRGRKVRASIDRALSKPRPKA